MCYLGTCILKRFKNHNLNNCIIKKNNNEHAYLLNLNYPVHVYMCVCIFALKK